VIGRRATERGAENTGQPNGESLYDRIRTPLERRRPGELVRLCREAVRLVFVVDRRTATWTAILQLVASLGLAAQLLIVRQILDGMVDAGAGDFDLAAIGLAVAALPVFVAILSFADTLSTDLTVLLGEKVGRRAVQQVTEVSIAVDLEAFERPEFHDRLEVARYNAGARNLTAVRAIVQLTGSVLAAIAIGGALLSIEPVLILMILAAGVPAALAAAGNSRDQYRLHEELMPIDRERGYLLGALTAPAMAKEIRAFDLGRLLADRLDGHYALRLQAIRRTVGRRIRRSLLADTARALGIAGTVLLLLWMLDTGRASLASVGAGLLGLLVLSQRLRTGMKAVGDLYEAALFLDDVADFMELRPRLDAARSTSPPPETFQRLDAEGISFTYPEAASPAIDDISLTLERGEVVALVGENGSGKTTLAKVLSGLYVPQQGHIYWDDTDVLTTDQRMLRERIAVVFQDYAHWAFSAADNIGLGRHERRHDLRAVRDAAVRAGADEHLSALPAGYDTVLSRRYPGGRDLSGGQWQRVALARALFRDAPLLILDEPTAALDPLAEARFFASLRKLMEGRTVLFISHRFSSVRLADRICVVDAGRIVEQGTHDDLMAHDGRYANMFRSQAAAFFDAERT
jgi:ATP-binding cassette subfamily B protein